MSDFNGIKIGWQRFWGAYWRPWPEVVGFVAGYLLFSSAVELIKLLWRLL